MGRSRYNKTSLAALISQKSDLSDIPIGSNPSLSAEKYLNAEQINLFFDDDLKVCQESMPEKYPYKLAHLVHHNYDMNKRWYVDFHAWDVSTNKLTRYRQFEPLNRIKGKHERILTGENLVRVINGQLRAGKVLGKDKLAASVSTRPTKLTLLEAITFVKEQKKLNGHRENYYRTFDILKSALTSWLEFRKQPDFYLKQFDRNDARDLMEYLRDEKQLANKSINNHFTNLGIAFKYIEKHAGQAVWRRDPLEAVDLLPVVVKKHAAFSDDQIKKIKDEIRKRASTTARNQRPGYAQLEFFIQFIFYTLARPNAELLKLKVGDIDVTGNRVYIRGEISKNKIDDFVPLPDALLNYIRERGILDYRPDYFIFGKAGTPGPDRLNSQALWKKHAYVLKALHLDKMNFSLYSYKHSGAISLYKATKDAKIVQLQCRHQSIAQTDAYLRDLGLVSHYEALKKWKGVV